MSENLKGISPDTEANRHVCDATESVQKALRHFGERQSLRELSRLLMSSEIPVSKTVEMIVRTRLYLNRFTHKMAVENTLAGLKGNLNTRIVTWNKPIDPDLLAAYDEEVATELQRCFLADGFNATPLKGNINGHQRHFFYKNQGRTDIIIDPSIGQNLIAGKRYTPLGNRPLHQYNMVFVGTPDMLLKELSTYSCNNSFVIPKITNGRITYTAVPLGEVQKEYQKIWGDSLADLKTRQPIPS